LESSEVKLLLARVGIEASEEDVEGVRDLFDKFQESLERVHAVDVDGIEPVTAPPTGADEGDRVP
jgi:Asp-tRNA(Asn)/Glu-tRNA(Gln) amidotransferase C subunit